MDYENAFKKLSKNPKKVCDEAIRILLKIAGNILKDPSNLKLRTLQKSNATISNKILLVNGATDCLELMGFEQNNTTFTIPSQASLNNITEFKNAIEKWQNSGSIGDSENLNFKEEPVKEGVKEFKSIIKKIDLPPLTLTNTNSFLRRIETYFHNALQYENKELQERAKKLIPIASLERNAQKKLRSIQKHIKENKLEDPDISVQDTLILELLNWFKEDFFNWVDTPDCIGCSGKTTFSRMCTDPTMLVYTERVELHLCNSCNQITPFPRYNDLNILLETRRGRCGEWANVFTLLCRAMGWDSRFVVEEGDHVWTEVYSMTQKRWLHCDPCENICDTPLVYENGWKKQISYVMAYSAEDVQDVTWRYSSYHKKVLKRRKNCREIDLLNALIKLRAARQKNFSEPRKLYLVKRCLHELVEFLTERKSNEEDQKGRSSGSEIWRLARGETHDVSTQVLHVWQINESDIINDEITLRYSPSLDMYEYISGGKNILKIDKWDKGAYEHSGIFRKEEKDWKMVYLCRKQGQEKGTVSWKLQVNHSFKRINIVKLYFNYEIFENALVDVEICSSGRSFLLRKDLKTTTIEEFSGENSLTITASLSGGKGDVSWQHAQLFRQSCDSTDFPFSLTITFK